MSDEELLELVEMELRELLSTYEFPGDDIPDMPAFRAVGLKVAVGNSSPELKEAADWILQTAGGQGAAREICETILKARGDWQAMLERK